MRKAFFAMPKVAKLWLFLENIRILSMNLILLSSEAKSSVLNSIVMPKFLILIFCLVFTSGQALAQSDSNLYVEVKKTKLREKPLHWAKSNGDLIYGDKLKQISFSNPWYQVKTEAGTTGFLHTSAVTKKIIKFKGAGQVDSTVSESDIVLAGKGFNKDIEQKFSGESPGLNYQAVDQLEKKVVSPLELDNFLRKGELNAEGFYPSLRSFSDE
ncbi:MAG: hypothetical protein R3A13_04335 [Bdellovibrionota bacterium]